MTNSSTSSEDNDPPNAIRRQSSAHAQFSSSPTSHAPSLLPFYTTPGSAPGSPTTLALDMKRLLAKPAPPYAYSYGQSTGSGSESEGFSGGSRQKTLFVDDRGDVPPKVGRSRSLQSLLDYQTLRQTDATTTERDDNYAKKNKEKRPRNVLRRRPSMTKSQNQKSYPALPAMTTTTFTATACLHTSLHSPLPPLSPRSPLTPSMFPAGSPASPSFTLASSSRQATAPGSSPRSGVYPTRSLLSFDKPLPLAPNLENNLQDRPSWSGPAQAPKKNEVDDGAEEYVISVTDEKGRKVNPRARLRELKGHPCPSSPSSSPSRSYPSSPHSDHKPHHFTAPSSLNNRSSSRNRSLPRKPRSSESEATSGPGTSLTPAAAVVAAYKQQENLHDTTPIVRRSIDVDVRASMKGYGKLGIGKKTKRPHTSSGHGRSATEIRPETSVMGIKYAPNEEPEGKHRPYYTVFGTSSDHVVAVGGPEDRHHLSWEIVPPYTLTHKGSEGGDGGGLRTLTRKMSGRFKRAGNGTQSEGEEERRRVSLHTERERGRQSFQGRSRVGAVLGEKGGLSLRLSIDKFAEVRPWGEKDTTPTSATKGRVTGGSTPSPSGGGSKIWKLMKRLSTGALREKFVNDVEAPPVPSIPKEYAVPDPIRSFDTKTEVLTTLPLAAGFGKAVRKKASVILGINTSNCGSSIKPPGQFSPLASQLPTPVIRPSPPMPRPSTTTRSSSPVSSDVASSRFFASHKPSSMSAHSSTSSLPIEDNGHLPPLPPSLFYKDSNFGQHIVPPSELGKMHVQSDDEQKHGHGGSEAPLTLNSPRNFTIQSSRSQMKLKVVVPSTPSSPVETHRVQDDYTITHTPLAPDMVSLSLPPRRPGLPLGRMRRDTYASLTAEVGKNQDGECEVDEVADENMKGWQWLWERSSSSNIEKDVDIDSRSGSPLIPSFSIEDPINTFSSKHTSTASRPNSKPSPSISSSIIHRYPSELGFIRSTAEPLPLPPRPERSPQRPSSTPTQSN